MATATKKRTTKKNAIKAQSTIGKINVEALKTTEELINGTIYTGAKWQKLYAKSLKKSEPIIAKNINIAFDTVETVVDQYQKSSKRVMALFGWDVKEVKKATTKVVAKARKTAKPATKRAASIAKKVTPAKASNTAKKASNAVKKAVSAAKSEVKATSKPAAKKINKTVTKTTTAVKKTTAKVTGTTKKVAAKVSTTIDTSNLKLINGIGPKMEALLKKEGYQSLEAISNATVADLKKVLDNADARYRLLNPNSWVADAKKALK